MHSFIRRNVLLLASSMVLLLSTGTGAIAASVQVGPTETADGVRTTALTGVTNPAANNLENQIVGDGAIRMNGQQAREHLSDNTQRWANGGAFYHADGTLDFIWEGKSFYDYSWDASNEGLVCIKNHEGFTTSCSLYFNYQEAVWTVVTEVFGERRDFFGGPDTILPGKKLSDLEPWDPALSGN